MICVHVLDPESALWGGRSDREDAHVDEKAGTRQTQMSLISQRLGRNGNRFA